MQCALGASFWVDLGRRGVDVWYDFDWIDGGESERVGSSA